MGGIRTAGLILVLLMVPPALADDGPPSTTAATQPNGFRPLPPYAPLPGQIVSMDDADERVRAQLPPPCTGRSRKGVEAGTWIGAALGVMAGLAASDGHDGTVTKAAKGLAGAGVGSTLGYLAGRAYDGDRDCPGMKNELPRSPIGPVVDEVTWEDRRRALAGGP